MALLVVKKGWTEQVIDQEAVVIDIENIKGNRMGKWYSGRGMLCASGWYLLGKNALCLLTGPTEHYFSLLNSSSLFLKEKEKEIEIYT